MNAGKIEINVIGCCAIRDIFGLHDEDGGYTIAKYVQNISPISAVTKSPLLRALTEEDESLFTETNRFIARCQRLELEKKAFDYIAGKASDYLVIDTAEFRRKLFYFPENDGWFSENYILRPMFEAYLESKIIPSCYEIYSPLDICTEKRDALLDDYCEKLCGLSQPDKIILVDIRGGGYPMLYDKRLSAEEIKTAEIFNERINYAFEYVRSRITGAHVVEFPDYVTIDHNHKWGRNLLHFVREYYDYALKAVNIIIKGAYCASREKQELEALKNEYEEVLKNRYS